MIIHKPSFSADLGMSKLPPYLLLAVCAVAAPLSKNKSVLSKASHPRLAGVPFFQDALALMFDNSGRLLCEPSVAQPRRSACWRCTKSPQATRGHAISGTSVRRRARAACAQHENILGLT